MVISQAPWDGVILEKVDKRSVLCLTCGGKEGRRGSISKS